MSARPSYFSALEVLTPAFTADLDRPAVSRTFLLFTSRVRALQPRLLPDNCAQGSEFLTASLTKLAEKIDESRCPDKLAELRKTLVGFKISIKNFSSYFFSTCHDSRRRKNAHSGDRCMERNQGWDIARIMLKCIDIALGCVFDEFFIHFPPTACFLRDPLDADLPLVQQPRGKNSCQATDGGATNAASAEMSEVFIASAASDASSGWTPVIGLQVSQ